MEKRQVASVLSFIAGGVGIITFLGLFFYLFTAALRNSGPSRFLLAVCVLDIGIVLATVTALAVGWTAFAAVPTVLVRPLIPTVRPGISPNSPTGLCGTVAPTPHSGSPMPSSCEAGVVLPNTTPQVMGGDEQGMPAIIPQTTVTDTRTPTFMGQAAIQYVSTHPLRGKISSAGSETIVSVKFLTNQEANAQLNARTNFASGRLLCVVELRGTFTVSGPPIVNPAGVVVPRTSTTQSAFEVFDAHTGNLVEEFVR